MLLEAQSHGNAGRILKIRQSLALNESESAERMKEGERI